jgi:hypothetical protein
VAYTDINFKTKKALKEALLAGKKIRVYQPGPHGGSLEGEVFLEGPHYPEPHKWYAICRVKDGEVIPGSVK